MTKLIKNEITWHFVPPDMVQLDVHNIPCQKAKLQMGRLIDSECETFCKTTFLDSLKRQVHRKQTNMKGWAGAVVDQKAEKK